jgi:hypothetical protein
LEVRQAHGSTLKAILQDCSTDVIHEQAGGAHRRQRQVPTTGTVWQVERGYDPPNGRLLDNSIVNELASRTRDQRCRLIPLFHPFGPIRDLKHHTIPIFARADPLFVAGSHGRYDQRVNSSICHAAEIDQERAIHLLLLVYSIVVDARRAASYRFSQSLTASQELYSSSSSTVSRVSLP